MNLMYTVHDCTMNNLFLEDHIIKAWFSYVRKIRNEQAFYFLPTIPDFADISVIRQRSVPDFSDYEFGGKWKVRQKSKLEHKCNSISAI